MMNERQLVWAQIYATILASLQVTATAGVTWEKLRDRARIEADFAMKTAQGYDE